MLSNWWLLSSKEEDYQASIIHYGPSHHQNQAHTSKKVLHGDRLANSCLRIISDKCDEQFSSTTYMYASRTVEQSNMCCIAYELH